jgi:hypothetical protein
MHHNSRATQQANSSSDQKASSKHKTVSDMICTNFNIKCPFLTLQMLSACSAVCRSPSVQGLLLEFSCHLEYYLPTACLHHQ